MEIEISQRSTRCDSEVMLVFNFLLYPLFRLWCLDLLMECCYSLENISFSDSMFPSMATTQPSGDWWQWFFVGSITFVDVEVSLMSLKQHWIWLHSTYFINVSGLCTVLLLYASTVQANSVKIISNITFFVNLQETLLDSRLSWLSILSSAQLHWSIG